MSKPAPKGNPPPQGIEDFRLKVLRKTTPNQPTAPTTATVDPAAEQMAKMTYTRTAKEVAAKLLALRAVTPVPPPLTAALAKVNEAETKRAAVGDIPAPKPAAGEVLVKVYATAVMPTELHWEPTFNQPDGQARPFRDEFR